MKLPRRKFLHLAAVAVSLPTASRYVWAQAYPTRPVRIIVGFPGGSGGALTTISVPILLPAPGRFSITNCRPSRSDSA
jgi:hypothetical protein